MSPSGYSLIYDIPLNDTSVKFLSFVAPYRGITLGDVCIITGLGGIGATQLAWYWWTRWLGAQGGATPVETGVCVRKGRWAGWYGKRESGITRRFMAMEIFEFFDIFDYFDVLKSLHNISKIQMKENCRRPHANYFLSSGFSGNISGTFF
jgi:hypothetical protein